MRPRSAARSWGKCGVSAELLLGVCGLCNDCLGQRGATGCTRGLDRVDVPLLSWLCRC